MARQDQRRSGLDRGICSCWSNLVGRLMAVTRIAVTQLVHHSDGEIWVDAVEEVGGESDEARLMDD